MFTKSNNRYSLFSENAQSQDAQPLYSRGFLKRFHLQETPSQYFIECLKERRLGADFIWAGRLFQIFEPKTLKVLLQYFTWFGLVPLRFKKFCFRAGFFECYNLRMSVIKARLRRFVILYVSKHRQHSLTIVIVLFFSSLKLVSSYSTTAAKLSC